MPDEIWSVVKGGNGQIAYNSRGTASVGFPVNAPSNPPVKFKIAGTKASLQFQGGDNSPHTTKALQIAELIARRS
jgi:hypothetical protein